MYVSDWDNTWTDTEAGAEPFRDGYVAGLAKAVHMKKEDVRAFMEKFEDDIVFNPNDHDWEINGFPVAPAVVDPFARVKRSATLLLKAIGKTKASKREQILEPLFQENYRRVEIIFRKGEEEALREIMLRFPTNFYVVSNSDPNPVRQQVATLMGHTGLSAPSGAWFEEHVIGGAKKYLPTLEPKVLPVRTVLPGFPRPVFPRRGRYYDVLQKIMRQRPISRLGMENLKCLGDIFQLDLLLPILFDARSGLLVNEFTPDYEVNYMRSHPQGRILYDIRFVPAFFSEE